MSTIPPPVPYGVQIDTDARKTVLDNKIPVTSQLSLQKMQYGLSQMKLFTSIQLKVYERI